MDSLIGKVFERLTVVEEVRHNNRQAWKCVCSCNGELKSKPVLGSDLLRGQVRSCGCLASESRTKLNKEQAKHNHSNTDSPTYTTWIEMRRRCRDTHRHNSKYYSLRNITVCEQWHGEEGFQTFLTDMGERPEGMTLDRIDPNGNYEPSNCRWSTAKVQSNNQRRATP